MSEYKERFQQWRARNADIEEKYLKTVDLINDYVGAVNHLEQIKQDFSGTAPTKFIEFDQFGTRTLGAVAFVKLIVDESREVFAQGTETNELYTLLTDLSKIFTQFYEKPRSIKTKDAQLLIERINQILDLDDALFSNERQTRLLLFSTYLLLQFVNPTFGSINYWINKLVSQVINVNSLTTDVANLQRKVENKVQRLILSSQNPESLELIKLPLQLLEEHFNQRYLRILTEENEHTSIKKIQLLQQELNKNSTDIARYLMIKQNIEKIHATKSLLKKAEENDAYVYGRQYFLDFIASNSDTYAIFKESLNNEEGQQFLEKVNQLSQATDDNDLTFKINKGFSWVIAPLAITYRAVTPQFIQGGVITRLPATRDSECKLMLKKIANDTLVQLAAVVAQEEHEFDDNQELADQPLDAFIALQEGLDATKRALNSYQKILLKIKENQVYLHQYQGYSEHLREFLCSYDGFWVTLSNYFAKICSIFKSDTAQMVEKAKAFQTQVDRVSKEYQTIIDEQMQKIDEDASLDAAVKTQLMEYFSVEMNVKGKWRSTSIPGKHSTSVLMLKLGRIFQAPDDEDAEFTPVATLPKSNPL
jgi:hypothetical protein